MEIEQVNPYPNQVLNLLDIVALWMMRPCKFFMDTGLSCFVPTTKEMQNPLPRLLYVILVLPVTIVMFFICLPMCIVAFCVWIPIKDLRTPYRISRVLNQNNNRKLKSSYSLATANLCIISDVMARYNNLTDGPKRAKQIGKVIVEQQLTLNDLQKPHTHVSNGYSVESKINEVHSNRNRFNDIDIEVKTSLPLLDILMLQETWEVPWVKPMMRQLHQLFPYIVYDAAENGLFKNWYGGNSGLMVASKYPIIDIQFHKFSHSCKYCVINSKGLLQIKVTLYLNFVYHLYLYMAVWP